MVQDGTENGEGESGKGESGREGKKPHKKTNINALKKTQRGP